MRGREVSRYSLDVLKKAAEHPTEPKGGVAPVLGHENTDEESDEEVDDDDDDDGTLERFGSTRRGNYFVYQYIRTSIEEAGKNIIALHFGTSWWICRSMHLLCRNS